VGSDLELAILSDRLTQSANTLISLQSDFASTKNQLWLTNGAQDESLAQQHFQRDSRTENIVPTTASQNDTLYPSSSSPAFSTDYLSTNPSEAATETASPEMTSKSTDSEISEMGEKDSHKESPANPSTTEATSTASNLSGPTP